MNPSSTPIAESQRIGLLDFLRGVAILGILTVNMYSFGLPQLGYFAPYAWGENTPADEFAFSASILLFQQKMYPLLAFLFGIGIYLLCEKEERTGRRRSTAVYLRRMALLAAFGLLHGILLWHGDILVWYACAGLLAYLMRNIPGRFLLPIAIFLVWGIGICCVGPLTGVMAAFPSKAIPHLEEYQMHPATLADAEELIGEPYWDNFIFFTQNVMQNPTATALEAHLFIEGSWLEVTPYRLMYYLNMAFSALIMMIPMVTGVMLLGVLAGRAGILVSNASHRTASWVAVGLGLLVGLPLCAIGVWMLWVKSPATMYGSLTLNMVGGPLMAGMYIVLLSAIYRTALGRLLAYPVECVGRTALSNYIGQTIVFVTLFQGWGFGWFGQLGYAQLSALVLVSWVVQLILSVVWLRLFHFGPLEWIWRSATYGRWQPFLRRGPSSAGE